MEAVEQAETVILLKAAKDGEKDPYVENLNELGLHTSCIPVLSFSFCHQEELLCSLKSPGSHGGLILTSPRAVQACRYAMEAMLESDKRRMMGEWARLPCFVVGNATATQAEEALGLHVIGREAGSADKLVPIILQEIPDKCSPLLFPCGNLRRETLPKELQNAGKELNCITCYKTTCDSMLEKNLLETQTKQGVPSFLVFFSPSGVQFTLPILQQIGWPLEHIKMIALGPTTAAALNDLQLSVAAMAEKPTPEQLQITICGILKH